MTSYVEEGNTEVNDESFMTMHRYGPWLINNAKHMEELAATILAISF